MLHQGVVGSDRPIHRCCPGEGRCRGSAGQTSLVGRLLDRVTGDRCDPVVLGMPFAHPPQMWGCSGRCGWGMGRFCSWYWLVVMVWLYPDTEMPHPVKGAAVVLSGWLFGLIHADGVR